MDCCHIMNSLNLTAILDLLDPTKVVNDVVVELILTFFGLLGAIIAGIVVFKYKWKKAEEKQQKEKLEQEQIKRREELKGYIHKHNQELIDTVIKPWYEHDVMSVVNKPHAMEHFIDYPNIQKLLKECPKSQILEDKKKIRGYIKNKSIDEIPIYLKLDDIFDQRSIFRNEFGDIVNRTEGDEIYELVADFAKTGKLTKDVEFKEFVDAIIKDKLLYEKFEIMRKNKTLLYEKTNEFEQCLKKIIHDFEKRHDELKGTCKDCNDWHDELESLK